MGMQVKFGVQSGSFSTYRNHGCSDLVGVQFCDVLPGLDRVWFVFFLAKTDLTPSKPVSHANI